MRAARLASPAARRLHGADPDAIQDVQDSQGRRDVAGQAQLRTERSESLCL